MTKKIIEMNTPLTLNISRFNGQLTGWHIADAKHGSVYPVCRKEAFEDGESSFDSMRDAEFIVKACNSHASLEKERDAYRDERNEAARILGLADVMFSVYGPMIDAHLGQKEGTFREKNATWSLIRTFLDDVPASK